MTLTNATRQINVPFDRRFQGVFLTAGAVLLSASLIIGGAPDPTLVHEQTWTLGHLVSCVAFLALIIGVAGLARIGDRVTTMLATIGCAVLTIRFTLSTASHLYQALVVPTLANRPDLQPQLADDGPLASIYAGHSDVVSLVLGIGMLTLAAAMVRSGRGLRTPAALVLIAALAEALDSPIAFPFFVVVFCWLGARLIRTGDVERPLTHRPTAPTATTGAN